MKKQESKGVATRSVRGQLSDSNDVGFLTKKRLEEMGAGSVKSKETAARSRRSIASKEVTKRSEESGIKIKSAYRSEDVPAAPKTSDKEPKSEAVVKKSGRRERRSVIPKTDVAIATESSRRRSVGKLMSVSDSDVEPAEKTAKEAKDKYLGATEEEKTLERRVGARRSVQRKLTPGGSISDSVGATETDKIPEGKLESELADENEPKKMKASKNSKRKSLRNLTSASSGVDTNSPAAAAEEVVMEITETSFKRSLKIVTESGSERVEETRYKMVESKVQNPSAVVFQTPSQPIRTMRSRSIALGLDSLKRKTPKNVRNSLILRTLSPEEGWVNLFISS